MDLITNHKKRFEHLIRKGTKVYDTYMQCIIGHAMEKTMYPDSDIYWKIFEHKYHFPSMFTAELIAMNHTDFIITSSFQEIAGRYTHTIYGTCYAQQKKNHP